MREWKPEDRIIKRAVELWKRALAQPIYQNTRPGDGKSAFASGLASILPKNNTPETLNAFGEALEKLLKSSTEGGYYITYLGVDYHPDPILQKAADEAGLKMQFPWKTRMILQEKCLSFAVGTGSKTCSTIHCQLIAGC